MNLVKLSPEVFLHVTKFLSAFDKYALKRTCRYANNLLVGKQGPFNRKDVILTVARINFAWCMPEFPRKNLKEFVIDAANMGNLAAVQHFRAIYRWDEAQNVLGLATARGDIPMLTWVLGTYVEGSGKDKISLNYGIAESAYNLETLQLIRDYGGRWNWLTTLAITRRKDAKMLKWAIDNGCPWHPSLCMEAAANARDIFRMKWLLANGCSIANSGKLICALLIERGWLKELKWAFEQGFPLHVEKGIKHCISEKNLEMLKWLLTLGAWDQDYLDMALRQPNNQPMIQWMQATFS